MAVALVGLAAYAGATAAGYAAYAGIAAMAAQGLAQMALAKKTKINQTGARLTDLKMATSSLGVGIPRYYGTGRGAGNMIWGPPFTEIINTSTESSGKGGGGTETTTTTYTYTASCAFLLGEGVIKGVKRIWAEGELVYDLDLNNSGYVGDLNSKIKVYLGTEDQEPDPTIESIEGVGNVEAYRGYAYIVFTSMLLTNFGNRVPSLTFEVIRSDDEVEIISTQFQNIEMNSTNYAQIGSHLLSTNQVNKSIVLGSNKAMAKYNPFTGFIEGSYTLPSATSYYLERFPRVPISYTYDGNIMRAGVHNNQTCLYVIDGDTMIPRNKYFGKDFNFDPLTETMTSAPPRVIWNNKYIQYVGLFCNTHGDTGDFYLTFQDYDTRPTGHKRLKFNKYSGDLYNNKYYYHRRVSIYDGDNFNSGLGWDIDQQEGILYYLCYQSANTTVVGADPSRFLSLSRIHLNFYEHEEEKYTLILDDDITSMNVLYCFFDQISRSFFVLYTGIDDNRTSTTNSPSLRLLKFNLDKEEITFDIMLTSSNGNIIDQDGKGWSIPSYGKLTHNLYSRKVYMQTGDKTLKIDIDIGAIEVYTQTFEKIPEPNYQTNVDFFYDLSTLFGGGYQNPTNTGPQIIKNIGRRFGDGQFNLAEVVTDLATSSGLTADDIDVTSLENDIVNGYIIANTTTIRGCLEQLATAYNFDVVETDWKLKFIKQGGTAVKNINYKDISAVSYSSDMSFNGLTTTETSELEMPALINLTYLDIDADYEQNTQDCARYTVETKEISDNDLPMAFYPNEAKNIATRLMWSTWIQKYTYTFETNYDYLELEPCDIITLTTDDATFTMKITKVEADAGIMKFTAVSVDAAVFDQDEIGGSSSSGNQTIKTLSTTSTYFLDIPILQTSDNNAGFYIAVAPSSPTMKWGGSSLYSSNDGSNYTALQSFNKKAVVGNSITKLSDFTDGNMVDYTSTVDIILQDGELSSCTFDQLLSGKNIALLNDELIGFQNATLIGTNTYRLDTLLRGRWNTEDEISNHDAGDRFILLNTDTIRRIKSDTSSINLLKYFKNVTIGKTVNETSINQFKNTAKGLICYPVSNFYSNRNNSGDINMNWYVNIRGNSFLSDYEEIDPDGNFYEIDILSDDLSQIKRTIIIDNATNYTYTASMQIADFSSLKSSVNMIIYKKNAIIGRGKGKKVIA